MGHQKGRLGMALAGLALTGLLALAWLGACARPSSTPAATAAATLPPTPSLPKVVIAIQPTANPEALAADSRELEAFLEGRLGTDVEIRVPTLYAGAIEALRFGHAQAAFMSAWPAALAIKYAQAELVLAEVREVVIGEEKVERPYYYSYWVVPRDSPYANLKDLKGKRAAFPSPLSTSGYVFPLAKLVELGLLDPAGKEGDPKQFFGEVYLAGGYAQGWEALKKGQVDVTVIAGDVSEKLYREVLAGTRVLEQQGPIPSHGIVFSPELEEPLRSRLKAALLELGQPERRPLMRKFLSAIFVGFQESNANSHLGALQQALNVSGLQYTEKLK